MKAEPRSTLVFTVYERFKKEEEEKNEIIERIHYLAWSVGWGRGREKNAGCCLQCCSIAVLICFFVYLIVFFFNYAPPNNSLFLSLSLYLANASECNLLPYLYWNLVHGIQQQQTKK